MSYPFIFFCVIILAIFMFLGTILEVGKAGVQLHSADRAVFLVFSLVAVGGIFAMVFMSLKETLKEKKMKPYLSKSAQSPVPLMSSVQWEEKFNYIQANVPGLKLKRSASEVEVLPESSSGFPVSFVFENEEPEKHINEPPSFTNSVLDLGGQEYTVYHFGEHHHFGAARAPEAIGMFLFGLSDIVRLKVVSRNGVDYSSCTEMKNSSGQSYKRHFFRLFATSVTWKFWVPKKVRYLQNHFLTGLQVEDLMNAMFPVEIK